MKIDGIFAHNDNMILGALDAIETADAKLNPVLVGFDGILEAREALKRGALTATIVQQPEKMGSLAVESMVQLYRGEKITPKVLVELKVMKK
jgi:ribose transport system substrate-binding protein